MGAVLLPVVGLFLNITLIILFYSKKHIYNKETQIYARLINFNFLFIVIGLLTFVVAKITNNLAYISYFQKIYMSVLIVIHYYSIKYCSIIFKLDSKKLKIFNYILIFITLICIILVLMLPLEVIYYADVLDGEGASYNVVIIYSVISFFIFSYLSVYLLFKRNSITKIIPFLLLIFLYLLGFILRNYHRELIFEGLFYSYIFFIMYHTIENPDLKMLNEIKLAKEELEKANQVKTEFISSMSHEIKTPLNAIVGFSDLARDAKTLKEAKENFNDIIDASNNLVSIMDKMMQVFAIEKQDSSIIEEIYNPKNVINEVLNLYREKIKDKNLDLIEKIDDNIPDLLGDSDIIKKIILYILENSYKFTKEGSISIKASYKKSYLNIEIEDTGIGIKREELDDIFNQFNKSTDTKNTSYSGMGLGLSITKRLVDILDGNIKIKSNYGKGTIVTIKLKQREGKNDESINS